MIHCALCGRRYLGGSFRDCGHCDPVENDIACELQSFFYEWANWLYTPEGRFAQFWAQRQIAGGHAAS